MKSFPTQVFETFLFFFFFFFYQRKDWVILVKIATKTAILFAYWIYIIRIEYAYRIKKKENCCGRYDKNAFQTG